jgi:23S rRNA G2445 N2-methylase RlmL
MKIKDAIADQFREKFQDQRPDVDSANPDVRIYVRGVKNKFEIAIDTSGESLFMRGYRKESGDAPMKENLAASLLAWQSGSKDACCRFYVWFRNDSYRSGDGCYESGSGIISS